MNIKDNLHRIEDEIQAACARARRSRSEVALMAVTKLHPTAAIREAASLGISLFGENRVQEFQRKREELAGQGYAFARTPEGNSSDSSHSLSHPASHLEFHLIGHLQSNKAARAAEIFSSIDTVDSVHLAERLNAAAAERGDRLPIFLEIKLSPEAAKTGLEPDSPELSMLLERLPDLSALDPEGIMTVPPYSEDPETARPYFARLRGLRDRFAAHYPKLNLQALSIGMSHDFQIAIEEGSNQIRIGTAIFGARSKPEMV